MTNPKIFNELRRLAVENGGLLKPKSVVDAARATDSPLHSQFTWDDSEAAERYRLHEARQLISVCCDYVGPNRDILTKVFVSLTPDRREAEGYRDVTTVMANSNYRDQLLSDALAELRVFQKKFKDLRELAEIFAALEKIAA